MRVEFNQLPNHARVWVYAASSTLSNSQKELIQVSADKFTEEWTAHQMPLSASFKIINDVFLVFGVDLAKHDISGCGIDKSIHLVQQWEQQLGINLFNRLQVEFQQNEKITFATKGKLAELLADGAIHQQTLFYNKMVANVGELNTQFYIPLVDSWVYKQLTKQSV